MRAVRPARARLTGWLLLALAGTATTACGGHAPRTLPGVRMAASGFGFVVRGSGAPVVVFVSGLGDGHDAWTPVLSDVAAFTTAFAYDRAGYGHSPPAVGARDGAAIVAELRGRLASAGLRPPYVLVGHSLGGMYVELYARAYPKEVVGAVLVDLRTHDFGARCAAAFGAATCAPPDSMVAGLSAPSRAELAGEPATAREVAAAGPMPDIPLVVLTRTEAGGDTAVFRLWQASQRELAASSRRGRQVLVPKAAHYIQRDAPAAVVAAIREVVASARAGARAGSR